MKKYVVGVIFDSTMTNILLLRKTHPEWHAGLLNGVGGRVEEDETFDEAMAREAEEEAGISGLTWHRIVSIKGKDYFVQFYYAVMPGPIVYCQRTEEELEIVLTCDCGAGRGRTWELIEPLPWVIDCIRYEVQHNGK